MFSSACPKSWEKSFFLAKLWTFKDWPFLPGGGGGGGGQEIIYPERTSPSHTCDLTQVCIDDSQTWHMLTPCVDCRVSTTTKGKVKRGLHCVRAMFSWFSPHTHLQYLKISSASFLYGNVKEPNTKMLIERKPAVSGRALFKGRWRTAGIDGVVPVVSLTPLPSRTTNKKRPFGKTFLEFWSHSTKVKALVISDISFREETTAWPKKKNLKPVSGFSGSIWPPGSASLVRSIAMFQQSTFGAFQHTFSLSGLASRVFIFAQVWFQLLMVSSSSFQEISKICLSLSCNNQSRLKKSRIDLVRTTGLWWRKRQ